MKKRIARFLAGRKPHGSLGIGELESLHSSPGNPDFNDSFYFSGHDGNTALFTRLGFRTTGGHEAWLCIDSKEFGVLELDTANAGAAAIADEIRLGGLAYACVDPGRKWRVRYEGPLRNGKRFVNAELDLEYEAATEIFDFKKHSDPSLLAEALAAETWSAAWFRRLKDLGQVHYEQGGRLRGTLSVGKKRVRLNIPSLRDHSFGTREWPAMSRHIWLAIMTADGRYTNISLVRYSFLRGLKAGYMADAASLSPLTSCSSLEEVSPGPGAPRQLALDFTAGGSSFTLKAELTRHFDFLMGGSYMIHEGLARFELNGTRGYGIAEFGFNRSLYDQHYKDK